MNYILGEFTSDYALQSAADKLKTLGFTLRNPGKTKEPTAFRIFKVGDKTVFTTGNYENYLKYKQQGMKLYSDCIVATLDEFIKTLQKDSKPSLNERKLALQKELAIKATLEHQHTQEIFPLIPPQHKSTPYISLDSKPLYKKIEEEVQNSISIDKSKLLNTYSKVSYELKAFLRLLFGEELFIEQTYKVGNKFNRKGETLVIAKVNASVVTMLDCKTFENFGISKPVANIEAITEAELRCLLGVWRSEFNLIK